MDHPIVVYILYCKLLHSPSWYIQIATAIANMHMMPDRAANVLTCCTAEEDYFNALDASIKGEKGISIILLSGCLQ